LRLFASSSPIRVSGSFVALFKMGGRYNPILCLTLVLLSYPTMLASLSWMAFLLVSYVRIHH